MLDRVARERQVPLAFTGVRAELAKDLRALDPETPVLLLNLFMRPPWEQN